MSVKNISNLTIKVVRGIYDTKNPTKEQIEECQR